VPPEEENAEEKVGGMLSFGNLILRSNDHSGTYAVRVEQDRSKKIHNCKTVRKTKAY